MKECAVHDVKRSRRKKLTIVLVVCALTALVVGAFRTDAEVRAWQLRKAERPLRDFAEACSRYGDWPPLAAGIAVTAIGARYRRSRRVVLVCTTMLAASILAGAIVNPIRAVTGRARPSKKIEAGWYSVRHEGRWLIGKHAYTSFPSAHTTVAFSLATPLILAGWRAGLCGFVIAALIGWSRLYLGVHHPSDVAVGAILGTVCGLAVLRSASARWWLWRAASAACGMRPHWPRSWAVPRWGRVTAGG